MICGLTTEEIARAFLVPEATIGQRIVRAKRTLSESGLSYETPRGNELSQRLASVLEVVYLIFNEGYTAARGDDWLRPQLCNEALRIGRVLISIAPARAGSAWAAGADGDERLAHRRSHRRDRRTHLLLDQNRALWDQLQIRRGMLALGKARELGGAGGFYALQAAIIACHAGAVKGRRDRLAAYIRAVCGTRGAGAFARDRTQPRGGGWHGRRAASRARHRGHSACTSPR